MKIKNMYTGMAAAWVSLTVDRKRPFEVIYSSRGEKGVWGGRGGRESRIYLILGS